jgi:predicted PurR-regulated permease PerM
MPELETRREWRVTGVVFFGLLALAVLWATVMIIWPFMSAIVVGAILVTVTFPLYKRVRARLRGSDTWAAVVMLLGITLVLIIPAVFLGILLVQQANSLMPHLQSMETQQIVAKLDLANRLMWVKRFVPSFDPATVSPQKLILPVVQKIPGWVAANGGAVIGSVAGVVVGFFLVLLSAFFFYVEGEAILDELAILSPLPEQYDREFASKFKDVIDATFRGQVMTSLAQGIATGVGLAIAGVPAALLWGAVATILSLLPMLGAAVVWIPATIYLFISGSTGHAIFLAIWGVVVVSTIDNVVRPWAMKGGAQLPAIPLLFAVLGGMQAFGFIGLVIGPLVFSLLMSIIDIYKQSFRIRRSVSEVA